MLVTLTEYKAAVNESTDILRNIYDRIWWNFCPGTTIVVKWPHDEYSADPNNFYRPFLEENVGKQGRDWNWRINNWENNTLLLKLRYGKTEWASYLTILWS